MAAWSLEKTSSRRASELLEDARRFQSAAAQPGCHIAVPDALGSLEEALRALSAAWYQWRRTPHPGSSNGDWPARGALTSRARRTLARAGFVLMGTLHDVAAGFARCANACRKGRSAVTAIIARRAAAAGQTIAGTATGFPRFQGKPGAARRVTGDDLSADLTPRSSTAVGRPSADERRRSSAGRCRGRV